MATREPQDAAIRPYRGQDRGAVLAMLGDARAIDSPSHRLHIAEERGELVGALVWRQPDAGDTAFLGSVVITLSDRLDLLYGLLAEAAREALARGLRKGLLTVADERLVERGRRDFDIDPRPSAWEPGTARAVQWDIEVDLADAQRQLERVLAARAAEGS